MVTDSGMEYALDSGTYNEITHFVESFKIIGFYFKFAAKFHPHAHSYFCRMDNLNDPWAKLCPLAVLLSLAKSNLLMSKMIFDPQKLQV